MANFTWVPLEKIQTEPEKGGLYKMLRDHYWVVDDTDHIPIFNGQSLQCHSNKEIVEAFSAKLFKEVNIRIVFLERAWIPIRCHDFDISLKGVVR